GLLLDAAEPQIVQDLGEESLLVAGEVTLRLFLEERQKVYRLTRERQGRLDLHRVGGGRLTELDERGGAHRGDEGREIDRGERFVTHGRLHAAQEPSLSSRPPRAGWPMLTGSHCSAISGSWPACLSQSFSVRTPARRLRSRTRISQSQALILL